LPDKIAAARAFFLSAGVRKGDRCAILAANGIALVIVDLAAMAEGELLSCRSIRDRLPPNSP
jgi:long-subunit acyl-CoA synthetase (AMP-forming)